MSNFKASTLPKIGKKLDFLDLLYGIRKVILIGHLNFTNLQILINWKDRLSFSG